MAGFVQIVEYQTSKFDEIQQVVDKWRAQTEGQRTAGRAMICKDRDRPNRYFTIVEFPSYEEAMRNSEMPETSAMAAELQRLTDGAPTFYNLDLERVEED
jgi:hypothetical protein